MGHGPLCPGRFGTSVDNKELPYKRRDLRTLGLKAISSCMLITALLRQIITLNTNTYSRCIFFHLMLLPLLSILYPNYFQCRHSPGTISLMSMTISLSVMPLHAAAALTSFFTTIMPTTNYASIFTVWYHLSPQVAYTVRISWS